MDEVLAEKFILCTRASKYKTALNTNTPNTKFKKINICKNRVFR